MFSSPMAASGCFLGAAVVVGLMPNTQNRDCASSNTDEAYRHAPWAVLDRRTLSWQGKIPFIWPCIGVTMKARNRAVVVGALGVIGRYIVERLQQDESWSIIGLSRRDADAGPRYRHISVDLLDQ